MAYFDPKLLSPAKEEVAAEEDLPDEPELAAEFEPVIEPAPTPELMEQEVEPPPQQH